LKTSKTEILLTDISQQAPKLMEAYHVPGLSLALVGNGGTILNKSFGVQSSITGEPVTQNTVFEAASLSKPVFAYVILKLYETKKLDLDKPLREYIAQPYIQDEPRLALLTARHVLSHSTGFPNWRPKGKPLKMYFRPGGRFSYSGEGFMYLQAVVEQVINQDISEYMAEAFFRPLGMKNSSFIWDGKVHLPIAVGHDENGDAKEKYLWKEMYAAASLHSTPSDFARFMRAILLPDPKNPSLLGEEMVKEMLSEQIQVNDSKPWDGDWPKAEIRTNHLVGWGLGWGIQHTSRGDSIWHWGDNGNYRAFALGYPADGSGMVIMTNGKNGQRVINFILREIVGGEYPGLDWLDS
jgi:CubicO group peptidase (beta-lactamase class C family)